MNTQTLLVATLYMLIVATFLFVVTQVKKKRAALHAAEMKGVQDAKAYAERVLYGDGNILAQDDDIELDVVEEGRKAYWTLQKKEGNPYKDIHKGLAWEIGWLEAQLIHLYRSCH